VVPAADTEWDATALRQWCRARLPEPMTPALFVPLASMPLTAYGKINRAGLPAPEPTARPLDELAPPSTSLEAALADIWSEVLKVGPIGSHDNFFDLGGHSLLATRVVARIRARFGVELPLRTLFESPTVAELAAAILDQELARAAALDPAELLHERT
jgi:acyl carrier protein